MACLEKVEGRKLEVIGEKSSCNSVICKLSVATDSPAASRTIKDRFGMRKSGTGEMDDEHG